MFWLPRGVVRGVVVSLVGMVGAVCVPYHPARGHAMAELGLLVVCHGAAPCRSAIGL